MMSILSSKTARLIMDIFKALSVSTSTWEALSKFLKPDKVEHGYWDLLSQLHTYPVSVLPISNTTVYMF